MKERVQKFGRFLSGMVMPNIGAFIAWGFITALFIPDGWFPNERINEMVSPMLNYLLPLLIGYTGGRMLADQKGAVTGAIATLGVIVGVPGTPMFIGAMIAGPLGGWCIKKFDQAMEGHIPAGFEMLVNNFSVGIIGGVLAVLSMFVIGPVCSALTGILGAGVGFLVGHGLLPLTAILVEPAKVLFLNNAINHGVFTPIGVQQATELGKSILFMIESNPGPGLGLLLAYVVAGKGSSKSSAAGAAFIQFVGGIHELYFPFVLMNPILILGPMTGNIVGIFLLQLLGGGLKAAASPGSIIAELLMTPRGAYFANIVGIAAACAVSFVVTLALMKLFVREEAEGDFEAAQAALAESKAIAKGQVPAANAVYVDPRDVKKIVFACDAGMGSSAMGATMLRNKLKGAGITDITVVHAPVSEVPKDCQIIVTHHELSARAANDNPGVRIIPIKNFMGAPEYDALVTEMVEGRGAAGAQSAGSVHAAEADKVQAGEILLKKENIKLGLKPVAPEQAIRDCGRMMVEAGIVEEGYIEGMIERNKSFPVAIGNHVAIPHGTNEARKFIIHNGLVCMTYPDGIAWDEDTVKLVVGIAVKDGGDHVDVLGAVAEAADTEEATDALVSSGDVDLIYKKLNGLA